MRLTISKCFNCKKNRLVDRVDEKWVCFACKQRDHISAVRTKPITAFVQDNN